MRAALVLALLLAAASARAAEPAPAPTPAPSRTLATAPAQPAAPAPAQAAQPASPPKPDADKGVAEAPKITVDTSQGFARISFLWSKPVTYDASIADGVLVLTFARPLRVMQGSLPLDAYVSVIKQDAGGKTLRMQLKQKLRLHASAGGPLIGIDLLPSAYAGTPGDVADPTAPPPAKGPVNVKLSIGAHQDSTDLVFDWGEKVEYEAKVEPGKVTAIFKRGGSVDVARLNKNPPAWVKSAKATGGDNQLLLEFTTDPESTVTHARKGNTVVFSVSVPKNDKDAHSDDPAIVIPPEIAAEAGDAKTPAKPPADEPPLRPGTDGAAIAADESEAQPPAAEPPANGKVKVGVHAETPATPAPTDHAEAAPAPDSPADHAEPPALPKPTAPPAFKVARVKDEIDLILPALIDQGAAMFRRADRVTIMFEGAAPIDAAAIVAAAKDRVGTAEVKTVDGVTVLNITLLQPASITAVQRDGGWVAALSPDPLAPPGSIALLRDARTVGPARVRASLDGATRVVEATDADSGEALKVVLAGGPPQGMIGARRYVDFAADPTAQGLVVRPFADDVTIATAPHDVTIGRPDGLTLAAGQVSEDDKAAKTSDAAPSAALDFASWEGAGGFLLERSRLLNDIKPVKDGEGGVEAGRLNLAKFYLAYDLGQEALGTLQLLAMDNEKMVNDPSFRALRAAALLIAGRPKEAAEDLSATDLTADPNTKLFRGLAAAGLGKWSQARDDIVAGEEAIGAYRNDWQARFRVAAAESALNTNALDIVDRMLNALPHDGVAAAEAETADLLRGQLAEKLKQTDDALRLYAKVEKAGYRPIAVRAAFAEISLKARTGAMKPADAIKALDELRWQWRGDDVELGILHQLGSLQVAQGDYRDGLQTMRAAVLGFPEAEEMHRIAAEMNVVFEDLFLHGKADNLPPVQALGLYYDFKELTPIGAMGDDMVRKLADRLIAVDLLGQAAELLQHQVDNRLDGIAKAQISAKLAAVYLMDRKPEKALATLRASSQTRLPDDLSAQRRLLSGRSLSDLKEYDAALDSFEQDDSPEARRLRADVQWAGSRWPQTAQAVEVLLAGRESDPRALDATDRYDILRAAVAYTMADDEGGLANLRQRFVAMIADAPEAAAFELVTRKIDPSAVAFRDMAKSVAGINTLDAFLRSLGLGKPAAGSASAQ